MNNSKKSEKSRGVVVFANNTETVNYVEIAEKTCKLASKFLKLPYTIITNTDTNQVKNTRYDIDSSSYVTWNNFNRCDVFDLSPYDETLVIDADYLILNDSLKQLFDLNFDYIIQKESRALTQQWQNTMGPYSLPHVWATVFLFRKTARAKLFFNLVKRIQKNYGYYHSLFNIRERNFRNDYAFAIADIIMNGYSIVNNGIPSNMLTIDQQIKSIEIKDNKIVVRDDAKAYVLPFTNLHIMSKRYLQSKNFDDFLDQVHNYAT